MPIARRTGDDEKRVGNFEDSHIFNPHTTVWIPHPCEDEETGTFALTETDFELDAMLSDYEIPTPFTDHEEQIGQNAKHAILQEENDDISAGYVQIFSFDDDIEHTEDYDEDSNLVESLGPTFKPTLQMAELGIPPKNDEREHEMRNKWNICKIRQAKINILMNEGLLRMAAAIQADMAFEKQQRDKGEILKSQHSC
jgi:hypothetical protein